jgi:hypothetical protein
MDLVLVVCRCANICIYMRSVSKVTQSPLLCRNAKGYILRLLAVCSVCCRWCIHTVLLPHQMMLLVMLSIYVLDVRYTACTCSKSSWVIPSRWETLHQGSPIYQCLVHSLSAESGWRSQEFLIWSSQSATSGLSSPTVSGQHWAQ